MDGDESEIGAVRMRYHCHVRLLGCLVGFKVPAPSCTLPLAACLGPQLASSILQGEGEAPLRPPLSTPDRPDAPESESARQSPLTSSACPAAASVPSSSLALLLPRPRPASASPSRVRS
ncbi:hypothetical protein PVAP13_5KG772050 [Panicum virgatum]|uniref:Uncharacterized protein n=1 Tax=Panicum virgatum TaxID=38727 RepID=A0A8T0T2H5_PANVG|nr:hypothetical protein PVAP13_5KG772050 [Panicum virgatum]